MIGVKEQTASLLTGGYAAIEEVKRHLAQSGHDKMDSRVTRLLEDSLRNLEGVMDRIYRSNPSLVKKNIDTLNTTVVMVDAGAVGKLEAVDLALLAYDEAGHPKGGARREAFVRQLGRQFGVEKKVATA